MNEEMATRLAQELLDAADEDARARVVVRWLPDFARCQVTTAARVKAQSVKIDALYGKVDALGNKMDAYPAPKQEVEEVKTMETGNAPQTRLALAMKFFKENWQSVVLFLLFLKAFGLEDLLKDLFTLAR